MEVPEWLTNAIIVLVVIFIIGAIIYLIAPETYKDIFSIAEETFEIGEEQKKAEAAQEIIGTTVEAFNLCIENAVEGCSCALDESSLPNGYIIWLKNTKDDEGKKILKMQAFTPQGAAISNARDFSNINVRLAVAGTAKTKNDIEKEGVICAESDMRIWNNNGKIRIGAETGGAGEVQWFDFYHETHSNQILKQGSNVCFLTNTVESGIVGMAGTIEDTERFNFIAEVDLPSNPTEAGRIAAEALRSLPACTGTDRSNYLVLWPVLPQNIISVDSCKDRPRELASSMGTNIPLTATEDSDVIVPVNKGAVTDYCLENCGDEGKSVTMYEVYDTGINWPTSRRIKIAGLKEIDEKYQVKGVIESTKITKGANVSAGDILGKATAKISYIQDFPMQVSRPANPGALLPFGIIEEEGILDTLSRNALEERFCSLPRLSAEKYKGEGCERITSINGCSRALTRGSLQEIADKISQLKNGESDKTVLSFIQGGRHYGYLFVFARGANAYTDEWIGIDVLAEDTPRPAICNMDKHCICLCMNENSCSSGLCQELPEYGFNPTTVNTAMIGSDNAREKTIHFQRLGERLGICTSTPCI
ncbi:MAG: hypothetical protein KJ955_08045 [Nanoarchaeota archaeon]|nr:hypothetical protein [Nanoarchaeota archaeon]